MSEIGVILAKVDKVQNHGKENLGLGL